MVKRPRLLPILSTVFFAIALAFPIQIMIIYGHGLHEMTAVCDKLTILNWLSMAALVATAAAVWRGAPAALFLLPATFGMIVLNNFVVGYYATDYSPWTTAWATLGFGALNLPAMHPRVWKIFSHPELRWWLTPERKRMSLPVLIESGRLSELQGETFDVSEAGVFVRDVLDVGIGDLITLRMKFGTLYQFRCQGRVVRRSAPKGNYPAGVGIAFTNLSRTQKRELRRHLER